MSEKPHDGKAAALSEGIVARGRTVTVDNAPCGPGEMVRLPASDIARLRKQGFLVDPDAPVIPVTSGPTFGTKAGPTVQRIA